MNNEEHLLKTAEMHCHSCETNKGKGLELGLVILSVILTLPLVIQMVVDIIPLWIQFALASIVQFVCGWRFYVGSYYSLKILTGNMDLLVAMGTSAAYLYSAVIFLRSLGGHTYFETSAVIITLVLLGRYLEARTQRKASGAIQALLNLQPKQARVQRNNAWQEIPISEIVIGDLFQVRPGESVPIDGVVSSGESYVDESMLTGESLPIHKTENMKVFGGTLNGQGAFTAHATAIGEETALASIIRLVQAAQSSRAPIQNLADAISGIFVPAVMVISLITFFLSWILIQFPEALVRGVSVLVIACPCALGLATPIVIMVASGLGARHGILVKNAEALQKAENLNIAAIDKTGTLTEGKPSLTDVIPDSPEIRHIAASLEDLSEHPIAQAIVKGYAGKKAPVTDFEAISGKGILGTIGNQKYLLGSLGWLKERGIGTDIQTVEKLEREAKTVVVLSDTKQPLAYLAVADTLRPFAREGVKQLQEQGIEVVMLTGDRTHTAHAIAGKAGISSYFAEILPQDKAAVVERLRTRKVLKSPIGLVRKLSRLNDHQRVNITEYGPVDDRSSPRLWHRSIWDFITLRVLKQKDHKVAMVGDGINDAPALAAADVGFAMSSGTDIALEASDITLMRGDLRHVADAIDLSKATFRKIRQNLFFAFIYNIFGIPLAAWGLLNPMIAGGAMAASSLCVVINSLLLNKWKPSR